LGVALEKAWLDATGFSGLNDPREWSENAVKLKMAPMVSRNEYRIHYCKPGSLFDTSWMRAEDIDGFSLTDAEAQTKRVGVRLFAALAQLEPKYLATNQCLRNCWSRARCSFRARPRIRDLIRRKSSQRQSFL
jgi:hypothetical protein